PSSLAFAGCGAHAQLDSFPTRRSSDLVRLKRYLEMRGADNVPSERLPALPAFWVGLLYDGASLDAAWEIARGWSATERQALRDEDRKSTRLNSSHVKISYAVFCLKKKN